MPSVARRAVATRRPAQGAVSDPVGGGPFRGGRNGINDFTYVAQGTSPLRNVSDLYIYPNTLQVVEVNGATVKEWLEMSAGQFNQIDTSKTEVQWLVNENFPTYNFDVIDGVSYEVDITQPARYRQGRDQGERRSAHQRPHLQRPAGIRPRSSTW